MVRYSKQKKFGNIKGDLIRTGAQETANQNKLRKLS